MDDGYVRRSGRVAFGGTVSRGEIDVVAAAYLHGMDGWRLATTTDPAELVVMRAALDRAVELAAERDEALARRIINALAAALK